MLAGPVYLGLILALLGFFSLLKPLEFLGVHSRLHSSYIFGGGLLIAGAALAFPAKEFQVPTVRTQLDQFAPAYQFNEFHSVRINAPADRVYRAVKTVTADEILFFRTLIWIRRFGRPGPESILNPPPGLPLLEVATRTSFVLLADEPEREMVIGTAVVAPRGWRPRKNVTPEDFKAIHAPGFAIATMNFLIAGAGSGACIVTTETRVYATDPATRRGFAIYWRLIYPGSALIRRMWLRAIKRRAEAPGP